LAGGEGFVDDFLRAEGLFAEFLDDGVVFLDALGEFFGKEVGLEEVTGAEAGAEAGAVIAGCAATGVAISIMAGNNRRMSVSERMKYIMARCSPADQRL
jgi:hypothetical protein